MLITPLIHIACCIFALYTVHQTYRSSNHRNIGYWVYVTAFISQIISIVPLHHINVHAIAPRLESITPFCLIIGVLYTLGYIKQRHHRILGLLFIVVLIVHISGAHHHLWSLSSFSLFSDMESFVPWFIIILTAVYRWIIQKRGSRTATQCKWSIIGSVLWSTSLYGSIFHPHQSLFLMLSNETMLYRSLAVVAFSECIRPSIIL